MDSIKCTYTASRLQKTTRARQDPKFHFSGGLMCTKQKCLFFFIYLFLQSIHRDFNNRCTKGVFSRAGSELIRGSALCVCGSWHRAWAAASKFLAILNVVFGLDWEGEWSKKKSSNAASIDPIYWKGTANHNRFLTSSSLLSRGYS